MRSALVPVLLNSVPGWVRSAYPGAWPTLSLAAHFDTGNYWAQGLGQVSADTLFSCTRASTKYVPNAAGVLVPIATGLLPIVVGTGNSIEQAATNVVLWNRDLTNAAWTKSNITAALNQTGADGTANAATSLTATAGNGTCLQAITLASSARFQSAYVKRITGSGVINMTMDNGVTWTAITVTAAYTQLTIPTQTLANPTVGFRIVTSGDAIAVDFVQNETGTLATSPIATTTVAVTRAADAITRSRTNPTTFSRVFSAVAAPGILGTNEFLWALADGGGTNNIQVYRDGAGHIIAKAIAGGSTYANLDLGLVANNAAFKVGIRMTASAFSAVLNGGSVSTGSGTAPTGMVTEYIGSDRSGGNQWDSVRKRDTEFSTGLADAQLQALTT